MYNTLAKLARGLLAAAAFSLAAAPVFADPPEGKGWKKQKHNDDGGYSSHGSGGSNAGSASALISAGISVAIARQIAVDTGIQMGGYKPLPPGIQKNLARGKPLPPGIAKKSAPPGMLSQLPHHPGYEWQMAGTDLVLVQIGTAIVADVLRDVFR